MYTWSLCTLGRRLKFYNTNFIDDYIDLGQVERAIQIEMDGPGRLLGYRSLHKKLRKKTWSKCLEKLGVQDVATNKSGSTRKKGNGGLSRRRQRNKAISPKVAKVARF